jgi:hypothetical protein
MDTVRPDQNIERDCRAVGKANSWLLLDIIDCFGPVAKLDRFRRQLQTQGVKQIGPMNGELWSAIFLFGGIRHFEFGGYLASIPHAADAMGRTRSRLLERRDDAEAVERAHRIGRQIDIGTDTLVITDLLIDLGVMPGLAQGDRSRHAADTPTTDSNL